MLNLDIECGFMRLIQGGMRLSIKVTRNGPRYPIMLFRRELRRLELIVTMDISLPPYPSLDVSSLSDVLDDTLPPPPPQNVLDDFMVSPYDVDIRAEAKLLDTYRGCKKIVIDKHMYKDVGGKGVKRYWRCVENHCDSKFHTVDGEIVHWVKTYHTHLPIHGKVAAEEALAEARVRATTTAESIKEIIQRAKARVHTRHADFMPSDDAFTRSLRRFRQQAGVRDLDAFRRTVNEEDFMRHREDDLVVFAADVDLRVLCSTKHWHSSREDAARGGD